MKKGTFLEGSLLFSEMSFIPVDFGIITLYYITVWGLSKYLAMIPAGLATGIPVLYFCNSAVIPDIWSSNPQI